MYSQKYFPSPPFTFTTTRRQRTVPRSRVFLLVATLSTRRLRRRYRRRLHNPGNFFSNLYTVRSPTCLQCVCAPHQYSISFPWPSTASLLPCHPLVETLSHLAPFCFTPPPLPCSSSSSLVPVFLPNPTCSYRPPPPCCLFHRPLVLSHRSKGSRQGRPFSLRVRLYLGAVANFDKRPMSPLSSVSPPCICLV